VLLFGILKSQAMTLTQTQTQVHHSASVASWFYSIVKQEGDGCLIPLWSYLLIMQQ